MAPPYKNIHPSVVVRSFVYASVIISYHKRERDEGGKSITWPTDRDSREGHGAEKREKRRESPNKEQHEVERNKETRMSLATYTLRSIHLYAYIRRVFVRECVIIREKEEGSK